MKFMLRSLSVMALTLSAATAFATPAHLVTHNNTDKESNAFIAGTIPSPYPTAAHSTRKVYWNMVRLACYGHVVDGRCPAVIKMETNTSNPIVIGTVSMNIESGDITPKKLSSNGYTLTVNGPGESTITKD